jgi:hypothetical protein
MKHLLPLLILSALPLAVRAQTTPPAAPAAEVPKLTEAQVNNVLGQLKTLEADILSKRGSNLTAILAKLNDGLASDQAATKLYTDCELLVNSERKEESKAEARARAEQMERNMERKGKGGGSANDEGDTALGIRFGLRYLILTLEAHEAKDEDFKKMVPKLQTYLSEMVASAAKLKGRAYGMINRVCGGNSPVIEAFQLDRYLEREGWSQSPTDIGGMYTTTILPLAEEESKESLPTLWDARINADGAFRKESMTEPEYILWGQNELPALRWERATYLYDKGPSAITAMADMLALIKGNPAHADAPAWVEELRTLVNQSAPIPVSSEADKPAAK